MAKKNRRGIFLTNMPVVRDLLKNTPSLADVKEGGYDSSKRMSKKRANQVVTMLHSLSKI